MKEEIKYKSIFIDKMNYVQLKTGYYIWWIITLPSNEYIYRKSTVVSYLIPNPVLSKNTIGLINPFF